MKQETSSVESPAKRYGRVTCMLEVHHAARGLNRAFKPCGPNPGSTLRFFPEYSFVFILFKVSYHSDEPLRVNVV